MTAHTPAAGDRRPRPSSRCYVDGCRWWSPLLGAAGLAEWKRHEQTQHRAATTEVAQMPAAAWHRQALDAIRTLAVSGRAFVISEVITLGVPDAPNPRTDWATVTNEAQSLGWIEPTGQLGHSVRPKTKGSPVTEWIGTFAARRRAA